MFSSRFLLLAFRLGLFQACLGALAVLTLGIFNRLLIEEFQVPAALAALALGAQQMVAFTRVWFGQRSDHVRPGGLRRTPYILWGALAFCTLFWVAGRTVLWLAAASQAGDAAAVLQRGLWLTLVFLLYGVAISASSTPFAALLVDVSTPRQRPQLVSIVWSMLTVGIVAGAILTSTFLGTACESADLNQVMASVERLIVIAPLIIMGLVLLGIVGIERRWSGQSNLEGTVAPKELGFFKSLSVLRADPQVAYFFGVLCLYTFSLFLQEAVLEPYGGAIFGMSVCETTNLNATWGIGLLVGVGSTGFLLVPRLGAQRTALIGGIIAALFIVLMVLAAPLESLLLFKLSLGMFGYGAGISTNASLTLMLGLTSPQMAGTFIGVWGLAQAYSRGGATILGGSLLSIFGQFWGGQNTFGAYASVFLIQAFGLVIAGLLLMRVNTSLFHQRIHQALGDLVIEELE